MGKRPSYVTVPLTYSVLLRRYHSVSKTSYATKFNNGIYRSIEGWFYGGHCRTGTVMLKRDVAEVIYSQLIHSWSHTRSSQKKIIARTVQDVDAITNPSGSGFDICWELSPHSQGCPSLHYDNSHNTTLTRHIDECARPYIVGAWKKGLSWALHCRVHSHAPSIRSHRGTKVVWPDSQPMRVPEEPVCVHLFRQKPVFTSLLLKSPVHVVPPQNTSLV